MGGPELLLAGLDLATHELALFAAVGFTVLGASDCLVDLIWIGRTLWRRATVYRRFERAKADTLGQARAAGPLAIFVPAWDESTVIGDMLRYAVAKFREADYRIYVGCYPNDPDTIAVVQSLAGPRLRLVVGGVPGPTTKAACLNRLWKAMLEDERAQGWRAKAVVLHDAEDVVHPAEFAIFDRLIERFDLVQLPVVPLIDPHSRWIAGHYIDEFAESHGKELVVREALGAAMPSAGVGCAFAREALEKIAARAGGDPFDATSLTEDYELGLRLSQIGGRGVFVRLPEGEGGAMVVTREYFPATFDAAVRQKARWVTGIALSGWDRLGWSGGLAERWMRLRDRQSVLAALLLFAAYLSLVLAGAVGAGHMLLGYVPAPIPAGLALLLTINAWLLVWRIAIRFGFVTRIHGWREGLRSVPRIVVGNAVAMMAARRAVIAYLRARRTGDVHWGKTAHAFPGTLIAR